MNVKIFFDESGKRTDKPTTMGGLLIPSNVYNFKIFNEYNEKLKNGDFKIHWTDFKGNYNQKQLIKKLVTDLMKFSSMFSFNAINYVKPNVIKPNSMCNNDFEKMIYTKLPERIFYGLLRFHGCSSNISANLFIEDATEYHKVKLSDKIKEQLNIQAMYRSENFSISDCDYKSKNVEIGVELTDLILGIIRTIILNNKESKSKIIKNNFVVELLEIEDFYTFLSNIKYFEWTGAYDLKEINFSQYIELFLSQQDSWLDYLFGLNE
ncbi:DUF3800 domain-containing protein [Clostridium tyrobutyricum]|uniref:DUF3800 domain-containing protein n=1 Tax=Clostridium tyrobutyricum TaxID=1519 RepID=UPI00164E1089|nr:DUF3800 domain-containing protein [Clostridium tyrobutyricum]